LADFDKQRLLELLNALLPQTHLAANNAYLIGSIFFGGKVILIKPISDRSKA
jgi:hypothetical protein